jgi:hypothetical protein
MQRSQTIIVTAVLAIVSATGVAIATGVIEVPGTTFGSSLRRGDESDPAANAGDAEQRRTQLARLARDPDIAPELVRLLEGLQLDLQAQHEAQQDLAAQLAELQRERSALNNVVAADPGVDTAAETLANGAQALLMERFRGRRGPVTEDRLVEAGFAADQAREIVSRADAIAMERLNVQYQAAREGWIDTDQYREALSSLPDVREIVTTEYGDDAYDRYLYAAGRPNRLVVRDVFQDSPASAAGLQPGDTVLAMADERIYSTRDLMNVASSGSAGETVPLVVERGDAVFELYVPRGPLGIRGGRGFENPATP